MLSRKKGATRKAEKTSGAVGFYTSPSQKDYQGNEFLRKNAEIEKSPPGARVCSSVTETLRVRLNLGRNIWMMGRNHKTREATNGENH